MTAPTPRPFVGKKGDVAPLGGRNVTVYDLETGKSHRVWPVDARELLATGKFSETPPEAPTPGSTEAEDIGNGVPSDEGAKGTKAKGTKAKGTKATE